MTPKVYFISTIEELEALEERTVRHAPPWVGAGVRLRNLLSNVLLGGLRKLWFREAGPLEKLSRVVVYIPDHLGDRLMAVPALASLRKACPRAAIALLTATAPRAVQELFGDHSLVDQIVCVDGPLATRGRMALCCHPDLDCLKGCDLFVNLSPFGNRGLTNAVSRELFIAHHLRARCAVGFRVKGWAGAKNLKRVLHLFVGNEPRRCKEVLAELGLEPVPPEEAIPRFPEARARVLNKLGGLQAGGPLVVLNPGAKGEVKRWPADRFAAVGRELSGQMNARIVAVGTQEEVESCSASLVGTSGLNLGGASPLQELIELLRMAALCITNDTGTMHLASMVGCPTVAVFTTRLSPRHWFPLGKRVVALMTYLKDCYDYRDEGGPHESLVALPAELIASEALSLMNPHLHKEQQAGN